MRNTSSKPFSNRKCSVITSYSIHYTKLYDHVPLIKVARDLGIEWHLLADGDPAGVKYVEGARSQLRGEREQDRLTLLPAQDIEHFLFENGFEEVFRKEAGVGPHQQLSPSRIIDKAVNRRSKPGMALAVVEAAEHLGPDSIRNNFV